MLEMLSVYYTKIWLRSVASKGNEWLHCKVQVRYVSLFPFPETVSADKLSVEIWTDALRRGNQTLNTKEWILYGKTFHRKVFAEVGVSLLQCVLSEFQQEVPKVLLQLAKWTYFRSIRVESWGTEKSVFKSCFAIKRGSSPGETNILSCTWMEMFILF